MVDCSGIECVGSAPAFSVLALKAIDSSLVSFSPDVDREGGAAGGRAVLALGCRQGQATEIRLLVGHRD
jgi:hypothetical protein